MDVKIDIDPNGDGGFSFSPCFRKICGRVPCLNTSSTWPALSRLNEEADHYDAAESGVRVITSPGSTTQILETLLRFLQGNTVLRRFGNNY